MRLSALRHFSSGHQQYSYVALPALADAARLARLPYSLRVLLENLARHQDDVNITDAHIQAVLDFNPQANSQQEIAFMPARVVLQDFTGVPCVVDLAAMRDAMVALGGDPRKINPLVPAELVIDHSVQVDHYAHADALDLNVRIEFERNRERYAFLRWGQTAFDNFKVVPPRTGIVHQVNLEYLARVVMTRIEGGQQLAYPDTVFGTDSHTTMINGLGVLGWGVGGIEAEAAMLGQPSSMLIPEVIGMRLSGRLPEGATATDLVLTVTEMLRKRGVVEKFVEFFGPGLDQLPLADRATIANMAPEYGATCGYFPVDEETLTYLKLSGRTDEHIDLVRAYFTAQGLFRTTDSPEPQYTDVLHLDLASVRPSLAGPKRPQDRVLLGAVKSSAATAIAEYAAVRASKSSSATPGRADFHTGSETLALNDGAVVIAAITSCTNTSNPSVMLGAGLLARNAVKRGLKRQPWVKTSLGPGSLVVSDYLEKSGTLRDLEALGFNVVGYGCTTCIGNSGPLPEAVSKAISDGDLAVAAVLSGNRNFEGRVHAEVRLNYLASPPLVVAYAIAGTTLIDLETEPLGVDSHGAPVYLRDIWPSNQEIAAEVLRILNADLFRNNYASVFAGDSRWNSIEVPVGERYAWDSASTYVQHPPYFSGISLEPKPIEEIHGARVLAMLGDSITTDHISPAGAIKATTPGGQYLIEHGVAKADFNSYGSRRGNHEVMMRGTFANVRLRNLLAPGTEGGYTCHQPSGEQMFIFDAAMRYQADQVPLIILAGKEYGTGSSRDWAAKGTLLLGVRIVIAQSYERIHRSNLVGMGVLPCRFRAGESASSLGLTGRERYDFAGLDGGHGKRLSVTATAEDGSSKQFEIDVLLETPREVEYYQHGGVLNYVLRQLAASGTAAQAA